MAKFYLDAIQVGVECLLLVAIGYILSYFKIISKTSFKKSDKFAGTVCFPILQFRAMASRKLKDFYFDPLINAMLMNATAQIVLCFLFLLPLKDPLAVYLSTTISTVFVNYVPIGQIITQSIYGHKYDHIIGICPLSNFIILVPMFLMFSKLYHIRQEKMQSGEGTAHLTCADVKYAIVTTCKSPQLIGTIIGLIYSAIGIDYPIFLQRLGDFLGDVVLVYCLVGAGHVLQVNSLIACHWTQLLFSLFVRFFLCPCISWLYVWAFRLKGTLARQCIIFSCMPASNAGYVMAQVAGVGVNVVSTMIFWTLILIVPVLILWYWIFDHFGLYIEE